jgi:hypothetical protein
VTTFTKAFDVMLSGNKEERKHLVISLAEQMSVVGS